MNMLFLPISLCMYCFLCQEDRENHPHPSSPGEFPHGLPYLNKRIILANIGMVLMCLVVFRVENGAVRVSALDAGNKGLYCLQRNFFNHKTKKWDSFYDHHMLAILNNVSNRIFFPIEARFSHWAPLHTCYPLYVPSNFLSIIIY